MYKIEADGYEYNFEIRPQSPTDKQVIDEEFKDDVYDISGEVGDLDVLDIGANIGAFSIFSVFNGAKMVYAYEPESNNYDLLVKNIKLNGLEDKIIPFKLGLGDENRIDYISNDHGNSKISKSGEEITITTLNDIIQNNCVLKVDIEGSEYEMFGAATEETMKKIKYITMEFHPVDKRIFGLLIAKLSLTHQIRIIGNYEIGGNIYAMRY